ncbi:MAG: DUF3048 domain-containing protein [bacterium]|nr:DUF3048 domain-containing protein [bacterium]
MIRLQKPQIIISLVLAFGGLLGGFISGKLVFSSQNQNPAPVIVANPASDQTVTPLPSGQPRTERCPLNGALHTKDERQLWQKRRPLFVMVENHKDSRPTAGLNSTDIVYEAVAEGGITRFGLVFYCSQEKDIKIAPVRSARVYFVNWAAEYGADPVYVHVGGAHCDPTTKQGCLNGAKADALGLIKKLGWEFYNDLNQFSVGFPTFYRDPNRLGKKIAIEHTMTTSTYKLWRYLKTKRKLTNVNKEGVAWDEDFTPWSWQPKDEVAEGDVKEISYDYWRGYPDYSERWVYQNGVYKRYNGGQLSLDYNTKQPVTTDNLVILFASEAKANDGYPNNVHLVYGNIGKGKALIFYKGNLIKANWRKKDRASRTIFTDSKGKEVKFVAGRIWISMLPLGNQVNY